jgi:hypothetical protein
VTLSLPLDRDDAARPLCVVKHPNGNVRRGSRSVEANRIGCTTAPTDRSKLQPIAADFKFNWARNFNNGLKIRQGATLQSIDAVSAPADSSPSAGLIEISKRVVRFRMVAPANFVAGCDNSAALA